MKLVVVPHDIEGGYPEMSRPPVASALVLLFEGRWDEVERGWDEVERGWDKARTPPRPSSSVTPLSPREHALVTLLAQGCTDCTAARELRISPRSVTNIMRGLMDRFGAENRFQLGLALGALRLVAPPAPPVPDADPDERG